MRCTTVQERSTSADVLTSLLATATVTAIQLDALGVRGGDCTADADADGICDDVDDCVGSYDARCVQWSRRDLRVRMF